MSIDTFVFLASKSYDRERYVAFDILSNFFERAFKLNVKSPLLQRGYQAFIKDCALANVAFYKNIQSVKTPRQLEAAIFFLEKEIDSDQLFACCLGKADPLETAQILLQLIQQYTDRPQVNKSYAELMEEEKVAIYELAKRDFNKRQRYWGEQFPDYPVFEKRLEIALTVFQLKEPGRNSHSLSLLIERILARYYNEHHRREFKYETLLPLFLEYKKRGLPGEILLRAHEAIFSKKDDVISAFANYVSLSKTQENLEAAVELLEEEMVANEVAFLWYIGVVDRTARHEELRKIKHRIITLAYGVEPLKDLSSGTEMLAVQKALQMESRSSDFIRKILEGALIAPQDPQVYARHFSFPVSLQRAVHAMVHKGVVRDYVEPVQQIHSLDTLTLWLRKLIKDYSGYGLRMIRKEILAFFDLSETEDLSKHPGKISKGNAVAFVEHLLNTLSQMTEKAKGLDILVPLLIAYTWYRDHVAHLRPQIEQFRMDGTAEEILNTLGALNEFYTDHVTNTIRHFFSKTPLTRHFIAEASQRLQKELSRVEQLTEKMTETTLLPSRTPLDCFFGYVGQDCLATEGYAIQALRDPGFVPYRILAEGKWQGMVYSLTKMDGGKKLLILPGIEPRIEFNVNPREFMDGLEQGFIEVAREGNYDMVLIPARGDSQSSRTATIQPEIRRRYQRTFTTSQKIGFPYNENGFYAEHDKFLIVYDKRRDEANRTSLEKANGTKTTANSNDVTLVTGWLSSPIQYIPPETPMAHIIARFAPTKSSTIRLTIDGDFVVRESWSTATKDKDKDMTPTREEKLETTMRKKVVVIDRSSEISSPLDVLRVLRERGANPLRMAQDPMQPSARGRISQRDLDTLRRQFAQAAQMAGLMVGLPVAPQDRALVPYPFVSDHEARALVKSTGLVRGLVLERKSEAMLLANERVVDFSNGHPRPSVERKDLSPQDLFDFYQLIFKEAHHFKMLLHLIQLRGTRVSPLKSSIDRIEETLEEGLHALLNGDFEGARGHFVETDQAVQQFQQTLRQEAEKVGLHIDKFGWITLKSEE